ncbi:MAG TPA: M48 family metalloprotease [Oculatellaceae cyanobacterium]
MSVIQPTTRRKFPRITSSAFEHPADRAALEAVKKIPVIDKVFSKLIELGYERILRVQLLGGCVHVTPKQCPKIYKMFKEAADILDMHEPDLFIGNSPFPNAVTMGVERPFIMLHSSLIDLLEEDELMAVIGHELGHVKAGHVLYKTIVVFLASVLHATMGLGRVATAGLEIALYDWNRKSELTADRAELLVVQDVEASIRLHMKLACGSKTVYNQINHEEFLRQADAYEELDHSTLNKIYKLLHEIWLTHPVPVFRAKEAKAWSESKQFKEIMAGRYPTEEPGTTIRTCPHCGAKLSPSFFFCPDCGKNARV